MQETLNIFGKNQEEIGSLDKNLVLRTLGQIYIRYGKKYLELIDNQGNFNCVTKKDFEIFKESIQKQLDDIKSKIS